MFSLIFFVVSKWTYGTNPVFEKPVQFSGWRILSSGKSGTGYGKSRTYLMPQHFPEKNFRIVSFLEVSSLDVSPHILFCRLQVDVRNQPCFRLLVRFSGWRIWSSGKSGIGYGKSRTDWRPQHFPERNFWIVSFFRGVIFGHFSPYFCRQWCTESTLFLTIGLILGLAHMGLWQQRNWLRKKSDRLNASTFLFILQLSPFCGTCRTFLLYSFSFPSIENSQHCVQSLLWHVSNNWYHPYKSLCFLWLRILIPRTRCAGENKGMLVDAYGVVFHCFFHGEFLE